MGTGKKKLLCICQICTCGRHHCVHHPKSDSRLKGPCAITEYKDTFRKFANYEPVKPLKPDGATGLSTKPFDGITSYTKEYVPHAIGGRFKREPAKYVKPSGNFDGISSYQHDYFEKFPEKMPSAKPCYQPTRHDQPFNGTTVHRETYKAWDLPINVGIRPSEAIHLPKSKFDHKSTFQDDFKGHTGHLGRDPIKIPEPALSLNTGKFADETTTRADYTAKDAHPEKSAKPPQHVLRHTNPFDNRTTCQHTYKWPDGKPAASCRPEQMTVQSKEPLNTDTTHNTTYKAWDIERRRKWKPKTGWIAPTDPFDHKTTFQHDYIKKHVGPAKSARPDYNRLKPGSFDGLTTHKDAFKPWEVNPRENFRPFEGYKGPRGRFDGRTTFQTDFTGSKANRPDLCIPKEGCIKFAGPQEFSTMYRDTFLGRRLSPCPAKDLNSRFGQTTRNGYVFKEDLNGHQFYQPPYVRSESLEVAHPSIHKSMEVLAL